MTEFTVDLHVHTSNSYDSLQPPHTVASYASAAGLSAIAITDHDAYGAHEAVAKAAEDLIVIPGMEVRTDDYDDLLALFISKPIQSDCFLEAVDEIHAQDGLAILPHPYRKVSEFSEELLQSVDAIETLNGRSKQKNNSGAKDLAYEQNQDMTGGSDAHTPWEIGRSRTVLEVETVETADDIKDAIRNGQISPAGTESPYYLFHGLSLAMETFKRIS